MTTRKKTQAIQVTILSVMIFLIIPISSFAANLHYEKWYQEKWCDGRGKTEVVLADRTRCDCVTATHSIEFDFGKKWAEAIGQSLYYSLQTGKRAGIVLIIETPKDVKYWIRLNSTIQHFNLPIDTWGIGAGVK